ncbi:hypothetical protein C8F04DRAFT_667909 [Mycena alexandri]|uniref:Uncharacterized protein n=1 Tax=Mycena alexandri TaxID=1745969 RepID=A0AAD6ST74_9AGAR|nr:hypothetical protein C8F04DRAFT_667909 [Mycena alexandri]
MWKRVYLFRRCVFPPYFFSPSSSLLVLTTFLLHHSSSIWMDHGLGTTEIPRNRSSTAAPASALAAEWEEMNGGGCSTMVEVSWIVHVAPRYRLCFSTLHRRLARPSSPTSDAIRPTWGALRAHSIRRGRVHPACDLRHRQQPPTRRQLPGEWEGGRMQEGRSA